MIARVLAYLRAQPPRTVLLAMSGLALLLLVQGALLLRHPVGEYLQVRRERAALGAYARAPRQTPVEIEGAERELGELKGRLAGAGSNFPPAGTIVPVVARLAAIAERHGAVLQGVRPAGTRRVLVFDETAFDAQLAGAYASLLALLEEVEGELHPLVVTRFSIKRGAMPGALMMDLRLAAYHLAASGGAAR